MAFQDITLKCKDCGKDFVWTASEQDFYQQKGFQNQPQRCPDCRKLKKAAIRGDRQMYKTVCASCGKDCEVPFMPKNDRPVYCNECFAKQKGNEVRTTPTGKPPVKETPIIEDVKVD